MENTIYIKDIHLGTIALNPLQNSLYHKLEVFRLNDVARLSRLMYQVYPSAITMRRDHSVGASYIAGQIVERLMEKQPELGLTINEKHLVQAALLLHDIGHTPYSHTLEILFEEQFHGKYKDHMEWTAALITGQEKMMWSSNIYQAVDGVQTKEIHEILKDFYLDPEDVASLVTCRYNDKKRRFPFLQEIVFGVIDADQLDYLKRDAWQVGVKHKGNYDYSRLLENLIVIDNKLCIEAATEALRVFQARATMYSDVYLHHTVRILDHMMRYAVSICREEPCMKNWYMFDDSKLLSTLKYEVQNPATRELIQRIELRMKFNCAFKINKLRICNIHTRDQIKQDMKSLEKFEKKVGIKNHIIKELNIPKERHHHLYIDFPIRILDISEPRLNKYDIPVYDKEDNTIYQFAEIYPESVKGLVEQAYPRRIFAVYSHEDYCDRIELIMKDLIQNLRKDENN